MPVSELRVEADARAENQQLILAGKRGKGRRQPKGRVRGWGRLSRPAYARNARDHRQTLAQARISVQGVEGAAFHRKLTVALATFQTFSSRCSRSHELMTR